LTCPKTSFLSAKCSLQEVYSVFERLAEHPAIASGHVLENLQCFLGLWDIHPPATLPFNQTGRRYRLAGVAQPLGPLLPACCAYAARVFRCRCAAMPAASSQKSNAIRARWITPIWQRSAPFRIGRDAPGVSHAHRPGGTSRTSAPYSSAPGSRSAPGNSMNAPA
jgi:hypothetical protein